MNKETVIPCATEFIQGMLKYAEEPFELNPRVLLAAYILSRFPISTFRHPERPLDVSVLNSANEVISVINEVIATHESNRDLAPAASRFIEVAGNYNTLYQEWKAVTLSEMRQAFFTASAVAAR
jgi:hypothetical protein